MEDDADGPASQDVEEADKSEKELHVYPGLGADAGTRKLRVSEASVLETEFGYLAWVMRKRIEG